MVTLIAVMLYVVAIFIYWVLMKKEMRLTREQINVREKHVKALEEANKEHWESHKLLVQQNALLFKILKGEKLEEDK
ncbi:hypothetical protein ACYRFS_02370 [Listeria kieliensis]